jgi:hypothetical protein
MYLFIDDNGNPVAARTPRDFQIGKDPRMLNQGGS